jgi:hypothetical protein
MDMRKSFILHIDTLEVLDRLTDEQAGQLFKAIRCHQLGMECHLEFGIEMALLPFTIQFSRDEAKYSVVCERNKTNGSKGGRPSNAKPKETQITQVVKNKPKKADSDSDSDSDSVSTKVDILPSKSKNPSQQEVIDYFTSNGYRADVASNAFHYYQDANWRDSRGKAVMNWKQKMRGVWFKDENKDKPKAGSTYTSTNKYRPV